MQFVVSAIGSAGDVHPFIALSQVLVGRGHRVRMLASPHFEARIRAAGIEFVALGAAGDYERMVQRPELWHPRRGTRLVLEELARRLPEAYAATAELAAPGDSVLVGSTLSWNVRLLQEKTGLPAATVHLAPMCLPSVEQPPVLPGVADLSRLPAWSVRLLFWAGERFAVDRWVGPRLNRLRAELGLPPVRRVWSRWTHSPDLVLGAWPDWFAAPQPDWPPRTETTGFPLFDEAAALDPALEDFLQGGEPPVGITPGSAMAHGASFFSHAVRACRSLGRRAVLLTPYPAQLPTPLPSGIRHFAYAPFSALLPRLSALVHHGGIGSSAQALAAGLPQIVAPFAHDQFDNAARLCRLGVARALRAGATTDDWVDALRRITEDPATAAATGSCAARIAGERPGAQQMADRLEALGAARLA